MSRGRLDEGIGYYLRSVKLDPHHAQVREYLGEAYVIKRDLASARYQLRKIKAICGNSECEEYEDLEKAIAGPRRKTDKNPAPAVRPWHRGRWNLPHLRHSLPFDSRN